MTDGIATIASERGVFTRTTTLTDGYRPAVQFDGFGAILAVTVEA